NTLNRIHGLQFWLVLRRSILPLKGQNAASAQLHPPRVDDAEQVRVEAYCPFTLIGLLDRHWFAGKRLRDMDQTAVPLDLAAMADPSDSRMVWILRLWRRIRHGPQARSIVLVGRRLAQCLVRTLFVVFASETIKCRLLLGQRGLRVVRH